MGGGEEEDANLTELVFSCDRVTSFCIVTRMYLNPDLSREFFSV